MYNRTKIVKICLACGHSFSVSPVRKNTARYCSPKCQHSRQMKYKLQYFHCAECGIKFNLSPSHAIRNKKTFCSLRCAGKFYSRLGDINNGITLCKKCHKDTDNYGFKGIKI